MSHHSLYGPLSLQSPRTAVTGAMRRHAHLCQDSYLSQTVIRHCQSAKPSDGGGSAHDIPGLRRVCTAPANALWLPAIRRVSWPIKGDTDVNFTREGWGVGGGGAGRTLVSTMTRLIGDWEMALFMWQTVVLSPIDYTVFTLFSASTHFLCKTKWRND